LIKGHDVPRIAIPKTPRLGDRNIAQSSPAKVKVQEIHQVALVVKDIQTTVKNYWNILGIGPWEIYLWEAPIVYNRTYYGKPAWAREKIALVQVGALQMELVQPVEGDSIYQDFLTEHGEGLHHINFLVDDLDGTAEILAKEGFPTIQSGRRGSPENPSGYNYIDIKPLHAIWEPVHKGDEGKGPKPTR
jgi:catechol 2,3-dioxygenase-like lactoylglutathione lyase family enzyme